MLISVSSAMPLGELFDAILYYAGAEEANTVWDDSQPHHEVLVSARLKFYTAAENVRAQRGGE
jgi:hypothetical protein